MRVGLRISVATAHGALRAVPHLLALLARHGARATFYFNLGPDRPHRLLPGREVGQRAAAALALVHDAGCEAGVYGWDPTRWTHRTAVRHGPWIESALERACDTFERLTGQPPRTHAAPGWQTGRHALRLTQRLGFHYAADTRGRHPYMPVCEAEPVLCPQLPTSLPTLDEAAAEARGAAAHEPVLAAMVDRDDHVFALRSELGTSAFEPAFGALLEAWRARGCEVVALRTLFESLEPARLPRHVVLPHELAARTGTCAVQGPQFLA